MNEAIYLWREYNQLLFSSKPFDPQRADVVDFMDDHKDALISHQNETAPVAVVIPAYQEARRLARTLAGIDLMLLAAPQAINVIVVDNASTDATSEIATYFGASVVDESKKGIGQARQSGLYATNPRNKTILTTDADTIVPTDWIEKHTNKLLDPNILFTYGGVRWCIDQYVSPNRKLGFATYMSIRKVIRSVRNLVIDFPVGVGGYNSGFRREQALAVGGYRSYLPASEDTFIMTDILDAFNGKATKIETQVISSARRIFATGLTNRLIDSAKINWKIFTEGVLPPHIEHESYPDYRPDEFPVQNIEQ